MEPGALEPRLTDPIHNNKSIRKKSLLEFHWPPKTHWIFQTISPSFLQSSSCSNVCSNNLCLGYQNMMVDTVCHCITAQSLTFSFLRWAHEGFWSLNWLDSECWQSSTAAAAAGLLHDVMELIRAEEELFSSSCQTQWTHRDNQTVPAANNQQIAGTAWSTDFKYHR